MTGTNLATQETFQEAIKARLREDIGTLIPDEVLAEMAKKSMDELFFTRRQTTTGGYNSRVIEHPSWFEDTVVKLLQETAQKEVDKYLSGNISKFQKAAEDCIKERAPEIFGNLLVSMLTNAKGNLKYDIENFIRNKLNGY